MRVRLGTVAPGRRIGIVSIHALVRVRRNESVYALFDENGFNPRTRESATNYSGRYLNGPKFQSTHS